MAESRVSIASGEEPADIRLARGFYAGALASEVTAAEERASAWALLKRRHPNLVGTSMPDGTETTIMKAVCEHVSVVDYTKLQFMQSHSAAGPIAHLTARDPYAGAPVTQLPKCNVSAAANRVFRAIVAFRG